MRVAMLSPLFESVPPRLYGGTERVISNLCRGLKDAHIEVVLFGSGDSCIEGQTIPVVEKALRLRKERVVDSASYSFRMLSMVAERAHEFDMIHNHHDYWMLPLSRLTQTPLVTTLHGRLDHPDLVAAYSSFPECSYVSISDCQADFLKSITWERTIYHGINVNDFVFHKNPGKYLAFLGRISAEKRPEWAIEIALQSGVPLKIAAKIEGIESQQYYDTFVKPYVDGKFIEYVGEITEAEKSEFLGNALALAFPIDWPEPFGLVMIESLACGTPVLARPSGAVPEILQDGITGYVDKDIQKLASRVKDIIKIDRNHCREWVKKNFSLQRMTEDYIRVYRHVAAKGAGSDRHRWNILHPVQRVADGNT